MTYLMFAALLTYCHPCTGTVERVIDGDTVVISINPWPQVHMRSSVRLRGINAPETRTKNKCEKAEGLQAKERVKQLLPVGARVKVWNIQHGKYAGRVLGDITIDDESVARTLMQEQLVVPYKGGTRTWHCQTNR